MVLRTKVLYLRIKVLSYRRTGLGVNIRVLIKKAFLTLIIFVENIEK